MEVTLDVNVYLNSLLGKKPENLILLNLRNLEAVADFFIICHAKSSRQVKAIAEYVRIDLKKHNIKPLGFEGLSEGNWAILDYGRVVIHVFQKYFRDVYNLEQIWSDAASFKIKKTNDFSNYYNGNDEINIFESVFIE